MKTPSYEYELLHQFEVIFRGTSAAAFNEAVQVSAMAARYCLDLFGEPASEGGKVECRIPIAFGEIDTDGDIIERGAFSLKPTSAPAKVETRYRCRACGEVSTGEPDCCNYGTQNPEQLEPAQPEPVAAEMPEKTGAERGLEEVYRFRDGRSLRRNGTVFETVGAFSYRDVLSKADTRELIQHFERTHAAQPAPAVAMTDELEILIAVCEQKAIDQCHEGMPEAAHNLRRTIDSVRSQAAEAGIKLPKVRAYLERENAYFTNLRGNEMLLAAIAELDTAEGRK